MKIKDVEKLVLPVLIRNEKARTDDFILYGGILKDKNIDLTTPVGYLLKDHEKYGIPPFESVTRCRRHIQRRMPELSKKSVAELRNRRQEEFKEYNKTDIGE